MTVRWDERYSGEEFLFGREPSAFLKGQAHRFKASESALAVADGEGRNGVFLATLGLHVHAIDASKVALAKSRRLAQESGVQLKLEQVDIADWAWPENAYDHVVAIFIQFAEPALRSRLFEHMKRAVKPGGLVLLHGYRPEQVALGTGGPSERSHMYTRQMLSDAFGDFDIELLDEHDSLVDEGSGHRGLSALIDFVARRPKAANV